MGWYVPCSALTVYTEHQEGCLACKNLLHASPKFLFWTIWLNLKVVALNSSCRLICVLDAFWAVTWLLMCDCERWQTSGAVKLYLFDVFTKLAIAADSAPDDSLQFHVCSDVIDIAVDVGTICWSVEKDYQHVCWHILFCIVLTEYWHRWASVKGIQTSEDHERMGHWVIFPDWDVDSLTEGRPAHKKPAQFIDKDYLC